MTDLRQNLIDVIKPYEGDTVMHGSSAPEMADEALAVFAAWLRERAAWSAGEATRLAKADDFPNSQLVREHTVAEVVLTSAADAIAP